MIKYINQKYFGYLREFISFLYSSIFFFRKKPKRKFIIFGRGRSGSTLLTSLLNSSKEIYCDKEILNRPVLNVMNFVKSRSTIFNRPVYGFKLLSYQLKNILNIDDNKKFIHHLCNSGYKIIYIRRENALRQTLSKLYAKHRAVWHQKKETTTLEKMYVDIKELSWHLEQSLILDEFELNLISGLPYFDVVYEKNLQNVEQQENLISSISKFLEVEHFQPSSELKKITPQKYSGFVKNSHELSKFLKDNGYEKYIE